MSRLAFIHTSPAAIAPLMQFYGAEAPEMEITNLLDDGLLRLLKAGDRRAAEARLSDMLRTAREVYGAEGAMLTCSAVPAAILDRLRACAGIPIVKIDEAMARRAVESGPRIGVAVTFAPTVEPTRRLLLDAGAKDIAVEIAPGAYDALLGGNAELHDKLLLQTVEHLAAAGANVIVLAQVSMARVLDRARARVTVPVLSSLETSLAAVRDALGAAA
jgi:aspartate/glutamate racemase